MVLCVLFLCGVAVVVVEDYDHSAASPDFTVLSAHGPDRFGQAVSDSQVVPLVTVVVFSGDGSFLMKTFQSWGRNSLVSQATCLEGVTAQRRPCCAWGAQKVAAQDERKSHKLLPNKDFRHEICPS